MGVETNDSIKKDNNNNKKLNNEEKYEEVKESLANYKHISDTTELKQRFEDLERKYQNFKPVLEHLANEIRNSQEKSERNKLMEFHNVFEDFVKEFEKVELTFRQIM